MARVPALGAVQPLDPRVRRFVRRLAARALIARALIGCAVAAPALVAAQDTTSDDPSPHSAIEALSERRTVRPGDRFTVALRVTLDPGWHTYWTNAGDAGLPLNVQWTLPEGATAGPLTFPAPRLMPQAPLMSYGYEREVVLLTEISLPETLPTRGRVRLSAAADWLACADVCLPAAGEVSLSLSLAAPGASGDADDVDDRARSVIERARARLPVDAGTMRVAAWATDSGYLLAVTGSAMGAAASFRAPYVFADSSGVIEHALPQRVARAGDTLYLALPRSPFADSQARHIGGILVADVGDEASQAWRVGASVEVGRAGRSRRAHAVALLATPGVQSVGGVGAGGGAPEALGAVEVVTMSDAASASRDMGLAAALLLAFIGGVLLNLMPCVFPVLSVKVLGLVEHGGGDPRVGRRHGLVFAAGVLVAFWMLAGMLMALRAGGERLGWGFQLQSPLVVAGLALVVFALALNLSGVFEMGLALTRLGAAGGGRSYADSFLTGALAVVVATPCTAPFMGAALGYALVQPVLAGMLVFTMLALGLAVPYVILTAVPALLRRLPRPGPWLETLKQLLAFPLYATAVWLLWVFGQQVSIDALAVLLLALVLLALGAWSWGRASRSAAGAWWGRAVAVLALVGAVGVASSAGASPRHATVQAGDRADALAWEEFSMARVAELRREGRPVFIDFTAAWCLSCQVNERVALGTDGVRRAFRDANVALLRADWTSRDAEIAAVLAGFGRSGVPLYVLYPSVIDGLPELLPTVLTSGSVIAAVRRAAGQGPAGTID